MKNIHIEGSKIAKILLYITLSTAFFFYIKATWLCFLQPLTDRVDCYIIRDENTPLDAKIGYIETYRKEIEENKKILKEQRADIEYSGNSIQKLKKRLQEEQDNIQKLKKAGYE